MKGAHVRPLMIGIVLWLVGGCVERELAFGGGGGDLAKSDFQSDDLTRVDLSTDLAGADLLTPDLAPPPGVIGDGCRLPTVLESEGPQRGTCAEGLICFGSHLNAPGGYCSKLCSVDSDCPPEAACPVYSGSICLKRCASVKECREGYICDKGFGTVTLCTMPDQPAP